MALLLLISTLCLSGFSVTSTAEQSATDILSSEFHALRQGISSDIMVSLLQAVGGSNELRNNAGFAGTYVNEYGQLTIGVTKENSSELRAYIHELPLNSIVSQNIQEYQAASSETSVYNIRTTTLTVSDFMEDCLHLQEMDYSYSYLKNLQDTLLDYHIELGIYETALLDAENCLEIRTEDENNREIILDWLSETIDDFDEAAIRIVVEPNSLSLSLSAYEDNATSQISASEISPLGFTYGYAYPGTGIISPDSSSRTPDATLGFCAMDRETGKYGIVVSAHAVRSSNEVYASGVADEGSTCYFLGNVSKKQLEGNLDAAFVPFSNTNAWGSHYRIQGISGLSIWRVAADDEYSAKTAIYGYGLINNSYSGSVISSSVNQTIQKGLFGKVYDFTDLMKFSASCVGGDSGSPIFISNSAGRKCLIGILCGGSGNIMYMIKIENILQEFSLEEYVPYRRGDINMDRVIDSTDAEKILKVAVNKITVSAEATILSDVDFNGVVNTTDARIVLERVG